MRMSSLRVVPHRQIYNKELEKCKIQLLARCGGNFDEKTDLIEKAVNELKVFGASSPITSPPIDYTVASGATQESLGGTYQTTRSGGRWKNIENQCHKNILDFELTFFCLKGLCKDETRLHVLF